MTRKASAITFILAFLFIFANVLPVGGQTSPSTPTPALNQEQISKLKIQVEALQAQLKVLKGVDGGTPALPSAAKKLDETLLECVRKAVEKREDAIISAAEIYSTTVLGLLRTRKSDLLAAWTIEDKDARKKARVEAWEKYIKGRNTAREVYRTAQKSAWLTFKLDRSACGHGPTGEDPDLDMSF